jgi:penicillin-binding protein activator
MRIPSLAIASLAALSIAGCATTRVDDTRGRATVYEDPSTPGRVQGVGIESQDIISMTDRMMRDMMQNPLLVNRATPARVIVDSEYFRNESSSRINKNTITDRLRVELNRSANGRMVFVGRHYSDMVEHERELKRSGVTDAGTIRQTQATAGADFRLGGRISSLDAIDARRGEQSRYHQIIFEMVDLEYGTIVWSGMYEMRRSAQDDIIYR